MAKMSNAGLNDRYWPSTVGRKNRENISRMGKSSPYEWDNPSILNIKSWFDIANEPCWSKSIINLKFYRGWQIEINQWLHQLITPLYSFDKNSIFYKKHFFLWKLRFFTKLKRYSTIKWTFGWFFYFSVLKELIRKRDQQFWEKMASLNILEKFAKISFGANNWYLLWNFTFTTAFITESNSWMSGKINYFRR